MLSQPMLSDEYRYKILKALQADPAISQRELACSLGISLGKANYCLQALRQKGMIKIRNFQNSECKRNYIYVLTPRGIEEKTASAARFLKRKLVEYDELQREIARLKEELIPARK